MVLFCAPTAPSADLCLRALAFDGEWCRLRPASAADRSNRLPTASTAARGCCHNLAGLRAPLRFVRFVASSALQPPARRFRAEVGGPRQNDDSLAANYSRPTTSDAAKAAGASAELDTHASGGSGGGKPPRKVALGGEGGEDDSEEYEDWTEEEERLLPHNMFGKLLAKYNHLLHSKPLITKALTAGIFCTFGDIFCQWLEERSVTIPIDVPRMVRMALVGLILNGPSHHYWYEWLDAWFPGEGNSAVAKKLLLDETIFAPFSVLAFYVLMSILEGEGPAFMARRLKNEFLRTLAADLSVWVPAQVVNFKWIPGIYTALYMDVIGLFWAVFLSWRAQQSSMHPHVHVEPAPTPTPQPTPAK